MVGCKTNVITSALVTGNEGIDAPQLPALLNGTTPRFDVHEVVADKGYLSYANQQAVVDAGATPYIPFKVNSVAVSTSHKNRSRDPGLWRKLFYYFQFQREAFVARYNARSNVECTFSGIKRVFGAALRSKTRVAQENELLCKLLCWNLSCLVHEMYESGINPIFWENDDDLPPPLPAQRDFNLPNGRAA